VHFIAEFDQLISGFSIWTEDGVQENLETIRIQSAVDVGDIVEFDKRENNVAQLQTGVSYVSNDNALENLQSDITTTFGRSFDKV